MTEKRYTNDEITVIWKPDVCVHSTNCWRRLGEVFDPKARPWVNINGAETHKIVGQIEECPSGALSYFYNSEGEKSLNTETDLIVEVKENGPLMVHGDILVRDVDGGEIPKNKVTAFCRCGASANKPYCDGSHKKIDFKG